MLEGGKRAGGAKRDSRPAPSDRPRPAGLTPSGAGLGGGAERDGGGEVRLGEVEAGSGWPQRSGPDADRRRRQPNRLPSAEKIHSFTATIVDGLVGGLVLVL